MAVQLPGAGTPVDATLLGSYALEINRLAGQLANSSKVSAVNSPPVSRDGGVSRNVITSELSFVGTYFDISKDSNTAQPTRNIDVPFTVGFAQVPVVVATPYTSNSSFSPKNISVLLTSVTTSAASFAIDYTNGAAFQGYLNVLAIGVSTKL